MPIGKLHAVFVDVLQKITPIITYPEERLKKTVSIQEKINHIREMVSRKATVYFHEILMRSKSKTDVVVNFLALLELIKARTVFVTQEQAFGDILIKKAA